MIKIFVNSIKRLIVFDESIKSIVIENPVYYRYVIYNIEEEMIFSNNDAKLDFKNNVLNIVNPMDININDGKFIKLLYKKLMIINKEDLLAKIEDLSNSIKTIIDEMSIDLEVPLTISDTPDISKLLSSYEVQFQDPTYESFLEMFIKYIKVHCMFNNIKIIVTFGLLNLFNEEEVQLLKDELNILEVFLLDINVQPKNTKISFIIDEDWCII